MKVKQLIGKLLDSDKDDLVLVSSDHEFSSGGLDYSDCVQIAKMGKDSEGNTTLLISRKYILMKVADFHKEFCKGRADAFKEIEEAGIKLPFPLTGPN